MPSESTILPPNHKRTPITTIPRNSLVGDASACRCIRLLAKSLYRCVLLLKLDSNLSSALKLFMILSPPRVSSSLDRISPCSRCTRSDFFLSLFPMREIINPIIGINVRTNIASFALNRNIAASAKIIVSGSRTISSRMLKNECCTSCTSEVTRAMVSPFLFSVKYATGSETIFSYIALRISFKTPFLKKVIKYIARYPKRFFKRNTLMMNTIIRVRAWALSF